MFHLALLSVGFSQQDSCVHLAMLSGYSHIDIHHRGPRAEEWEPSGGLNSGYVFSKIIVICQEKFIVFVATNFGEKRPLCLIFHGIAGFSPWKIRYIALSPLRVETGCFAPRVLLPSCHLLCQPVGMMQPAKP